jgi:type II secretory pathway pseudopilin PulG
VVIAIIGVMAGLLLPAISHAREKARQAHCMNNLKQFSIGINVYRNDHDSMPPPWLSSLYPNYIAGNKGIYICRSDRSQGADGSKPDEAHGGTDSLVGSQFVETDDTKGRNGITACSYMYELCDTNCSYADASTYPGSGLTAISTWYAVKMYELQQHYTGEETLFPVIRCFNHCGERTIRVYTNGTDIASIRETPVTLNVTYAGNVLITGVDWTHKLVAE